eukprot:GFYU01003417.1.p1 GENE.GFYU01003417.1~~GFYU01003417.1.p1  ORF type:complete len:1305 (-),score=175.36 GFYU01003417.1:1299-5213(-)
MGPESYAGSVIVDRTIEEVTAPQFTNAFLANVTQIAGVPPGNARITEYKSLGKSLADWQALQASGGRRMLQEISVNDAAQIIFEVYPTESKPQDVAQRLKNPDVGLAATLNTTLAFDERADRIHQWAQGYCGSGYTGLACGTCDTNYYRFEQTCRKCPDDGGLTVVLVAFGFVAFLALTSLFSNAREALSSAGLAVSRLFDAGSISLTFLQVNSLFISFAIPWPQFVIDVMDIISILTLNLELARPECSFATSYRGKWYMVMAILPVAAFIMYLFRAVGVVYFTIKGEEEDRKLKGLGESKMNNEIYAHWHSWHKGSKTSVSKSQGSKSSISASSAKSINEMLHQSIKRQTSSQQLVLGPEDFAIYNQDTESEDQSNQGSDRSSFMSAIDHRDSLPVDNDEGGLETRSLSSEEAASIAQFDGANDDRSDSGHRSESDESSDLSSDRSTEFDAGSARGTPRLERGSPMSSERSFDTSVASTHSPLGSPVVGSPPRPRPSTLSVSETGSKQGFFSRIFNSKKKAQPGVDIRNLDSIPESETAASAPSVPRLSIPLNMDFQRMKGSARSSVRSSSRASHLEPMSSSRSASLVSTSRRSIAADSDLMIAAKVAAHSNAIRFQSASVSETPTSVGSLASLASPASSAHDQESPWYGTSESGTKSGSGGGTSRSSATTIELPEIEENQHDPQFWRRGHSITRFEYSLTNAYIMFMSIAYIIVTRKAFEVFACQRGEQFDFMVAAPEVRCDLDNDPEYQILFPQAIIAVMVYAFGIPLGFCYLLFSNRKILGDDTTYYRLGFLTEKYERKYYYWEIMIVVRKFGLVATGLFFTDTPFFQACIGLLVIFMSVCADLYTRPYIDDVHDQLDIALLLNNFVVLVLGLAFVADKFPTALTKQVFAVFAVSVICVGVSLILVVVMIILRKAYELRLAQGGRIDHLNETVDAIVQVQAEGDTVLDKIINDVFHEDYQPYVVYALVDSVFGGREIKSLHSHICHFSQIYYASDLDYVTKAKYLRIYRKVVANKALLAKQEVYADLQAQGVKYPRWHLAKEAITNYRQRVKYKRQRRVSRAKAVLAKYNRTEETHKNTRRGVFGSWRSTGSSVDIKKEYLRRRSTRVMLEDDSAQIAEETKVNEDEGSPRSDTEYSDAHHLDSAPSDSGSSVHVGQADAQLARSVSGSTLMSDAESDIVAEFDNKPLNTSGGSLARSNSSSSDLFAREREKERLVQKIKERQRELELAKSIARRTTPLVGTRPTSPGRSGRSSDRSDDTDSTDSKLSNFSRKDTFYEQPTTPRSTLSAQSGGAGVGRGR